MTASNSRHNEWTRRPFAEVIDFQEGPGIMARDFRAQGVPLLRLAGLQRGSQLLDGCNYLDPDDVERRWAHFRLRKNDVLLSTSATLGRTAVVSEQAEGSIAYTGIIRMRPKNSEVQSSFIKYMLESPDFQQQVEAMGVGSVMRHFGPSHLREMTVLLPSTREQHAIAHILSTLDNKIELNRQMNQTLEQIAAALFRSWFVDFDPVRAKAEGRQPEGMDADTAALFPDRLVESEIGEIPEGWALGILGDIATVRRDIANPLDVAPETPYFGLEHLPRESIALSEWGAAGNISSAKSKFQQGDILFGKLRPYFHKVGVAPINGLCSTDILVIRPSFRAYFGCVLGFSSSREIIQYSDQGSEGTRMPRVSWAYLSKYRIAVPPIVIAGAFTNLVQPQIERIHANIFQNRTLAKLRDTLLPRLLSGELRVPLDILNEEEMTVPNPRDEALAQSTF